MTMLTTFTTPVTETPADGGVTHKLLGYHFLRIDRRLRWNDVGVIEAGRTITVSPPLVFCTNGLHAGILPLDALRRAPGPILCRVGLDGEILTDTSEVCAESRTVLWMHDATLALHEFACNEAELVLLAERAVGREPHEASWHAIEVKRRWLRGEATLDDLSAAESAAWSAAWSAQNERLEAAFEAMHAAHAAAGTV